MKSNILLSSPFEIVRVVHTVTHSIVIVFQTAVANLSALSSPPAGTPSPLVLSPAPVSVQIPEAAPPTANPTTSAMPKPLKPATAVPSCVTPEASVV